MTKLQFQQEHLGLFVGGIDRFIPDSLIDAICTGDGTKQLLIGDAFQGIDIARMGGDETVMSSFNRINKDRITQFDLTIPEPQTITDTARLIIHKDIHINHKKIYMDDGASMCASIVIESDMSGFTSLDEAITMLNFLNNAINRGLSNLRVIAKRDFINAA